MGNCHQLEYLQKITLEPFELFEDFKNGLIQRNSDLEAQFEILQNSCIDKVELDEYQSIKKELDIKREDQKKYKTIVVEQTNMISSYKDLIENQKNKILEVGDDNQGLHSRLIDLQKDNEELAHILKLYEDRVGDANMRSSADWCKDKEEIHGLRDAIGGLEDKLMKRDEKIKLMKNNLHKLNEKFTKHEQSHNLKIKEVIPQAFSQNKFFIGRDWTREERSV